MFHLKHVWRLIAQFAIDHPATVNHESTDTCGILWCMCLGYHDLPRQRTTSSGWVLDGRCGGVVSSERRVAVPALHAPTLAQLAFSFEFESQTPRHICTQRTMLPSLLPNFTTHATAGCQRAASFLPALASLHNSQKLNAGTANTNPSRADCVTLLQAQSSPLMHRKE